MSEILEGTGEFNRQHQLNGANLEGASQTETPPEEEYQPFQQILPDVAEGFDMNGDYHAVKQTALEGLGTAITPYRWASYLQDALQQYISNFEYTVGKSERWDIVQDIVSDRMERAANMEERYALEDALQIWFRSYGGGNGN